MWHFLIFCRFVRYFDSLRWILTDSLWHSLWFTDFRTEGQASLLYNIRRVYFELLWYIRLSRCLRIVSSVMIIFYIYLWLAIFSFFVLVCYFSNFQQPQWPLHYCTQCTVTDLDMMAKLRIRNNFTRIGSGFRIFKNFASGFLSVKMWHYLRFFVSFLIISNVSIGVFS